MPIQFIKEAFDKGRKDCIEGTMPMTDKDLAEKGEDWTGNYWEGWEKTAEIFSCPD